MRSLSAVLMTHVVQPIGRLIVGAQAIEADPVDQCCCPALFLEVGAYDPACTAPVHGGA